MCFSLFKMSELGPVGKIRWIKLRWFTLEIDPKYWRTFQNLLNWRLDKKRKLPKFQNCIVCWKRKKFWITKNDFHPSSLPLLSTNRNCYNRWNENVCNNNNNNNGVQFLCWFIFIRSFIDHKYVTLHCLPVRMETVNTWKTINRYQIGKDGIERNGRCWAPNVVVYHFPCWIFIKSRFVFDVPGKIRFCFLSIRMIYFCPVVEQFVTVLRLFNSQPNQTTYETFVSDLEIICC